MNETITNNILIFIHESLQVCILILQYLIIIEINRLNFITPMAFAFQYHNELMHDIK